MNAFDAILGEPWMIVEDRLQEIVSISRRENVVTPEALEKYASDDLRRAERAKIRDGVAILYVDGPLFKRANLFTQMSGATSYDVLMRDLQVALDDPSVSAIMVRIDSPGGLVSGCDEFAEALYQARKQKRVEAYVSGAGMSAAYWIASATQKITISPTTGVGSIGAAVLVRKSSNDNEIEFVSSQSPRKRPDVETEEGRSDIQAQLDDIASVFIDTVARNRGVSVDDVMTKYGQGGVEFGAKAVAQGMADAVGQFEDVLASLSSGARRPTLTKRGANMSDTTQGDQQVASTADIDKAKADAAAEAKTATAKRIKDITSSDAAKAMPTLAEALAFETDLSAEASGVLLAAAAEDKDAAVAAAKPEESGQDYEERRSEASNLASRQPTGSDPEAHGGQKSNPVLASVRAMNNAS